MSVALLSAVEQMLLLSSRKISPLELAEEYIRRVERIDPEIHALVDFSADRVLAQAVAPRQGLLSGLPITIKSSIGVEGFRCEVGSTLRRGVVAHGDAEAVARVRREGAIFLGTTNCPEFLMAYETDNLLNGPTRNPWDLGRSAGGSSGGEAAAIAAGLSAGGFGSDSGGSVREPAHFTGICALKPTPGRISSRGHEPPCVGPFRTLGSIGPMARTIDDVELLFRAAREDDGAYRAATADGLTFGVLDPDSGGPVTAETHDAVQAAAGALERGGLRAVRFRSDLLAEARDLWRIFFVQCGAMFYQDTVAGRRADLSPIFRDFLETAEAEKPLTAKDLLAAWAAMDQLRDRWSDATRDVPILLTPVCSVPAFRHGERQWTIDGEAVGYWDAMRFTQWFNLLACPAAVVPVGVSAEGLPIGVQIAGRPGEDERVLAVAKLLDRAFGYRPPPIALA